MVTLALALGGCGSESDGGRIDAEAETVDAEAEVPRVARTALEMLAHGGQLTEVCQLAARALRQDCLGSSEDARLDPDPFFASLELTGSKRHRDPAIVNFHNGRQGVLGMVVSDGRVIGMAHAYEQEIEDREAPPLYGRGLEGRARMSEDSGLAVATVGRALERIAASDSAGFCELATASAGLQFFDVIEIGETEDFLNAGRSCEEVLDTGLRIMRDPDRGGSTDGLGTGGVFSLEEPERLLSVSIRPTGEPAKGQLRGWPTLSAWLVDEGEGWRVRGAGRVVPE